METRGSRPASSPEAMYQVVQGGWYGFPDFFVGLPIDSPQRAPENGQPPSPRVLLNPPALAQQASQPFATFPNHATPVGLDLSRTAAFAPLGTAFVSLFGDLTPVTSGGVTEPTGHQVIQVAATGTVTTPFVTSTVTSTLGQLVFRPTDATFHPTLPILYVTHFGEINAVPGGVAPRPGTGALFAITPLAAPPVVPEWSTIFMIGTGLAGLGLYGLNRLHRRRPRGRGSEAAR